MHNRDTPADDAVEQGRFAHVRPTDDCNDCCHFHSMGPPPQPAKSNPTSAQAGAALLTPKAAPGQPALDEAGVAAAAELEDVRRAHLDRPWLGRAGELKLEHRARERA